MSKTECMIIRGADLNDAGQLFRPKSSWPDHHWTTMLLDTTDPRVNFSVKYDDGEFMLSLSKDAPEEDEALFNHVMRFSRLNNLDFSCCTTECERCKGHPNCLANGVYK